MAAWDLIATTVAEKPGFSKPDINAKSAQAHYNHLMAEHRANAPALVVASGDSQDYPEIMKMLDELMILEAENANALALGQPLQRDQNGTAVLAMQGIREAAAQGLALKRSKSITDNENTEPPKKARKLTDMDKAVIELEKERKLREEAMREDRLERRREMEADREERRRNQEAAMAFQRDIASIFASQLGAIGAAFASALGRGQE